jgi:hypothetical protein
MTSSTEEVDMKAYAKTIMAFFTSLGTWGGTAFVDGHLTAVEAFGLCGVLVVTVGVWAVPNDPA